MVFLKNALMCIKKVKLINHDCLPILMLLYVMLTYLMLFAALSNAVCIMLFLLLIFANALCFHALSWFIDTLFVYFKHDFPSCTVLLICWFFIILCSHLFYMKGLYALEK